MSQETKNLVTMILQIAFGVIVTIYLGINSWALITLVHHGEKLEVITAVVSRLPNEYPPLAYQQKIDARFEKVDNKLDDNKTIMLDIQRKVTK